MLRNRKTQAADTDSSIGNAQKSPTMDYKVRDSQKRPRRSFRGNYFMNFSLFHVSAVESSLRSACTTQPSSAIDDGDFRRVISANARRF